MLESLSLKSVMCLLYREKVRAERRSHEEPFVFCFFFVVVVTCCYLGL